MTEDTNNGYDGKGLKGPAYWIASILTAGVADRFLRGGGLSGLFGPPPGGPGAPVSREVLDLTTENQGLKSQLYTNTLNAQQSVWNAAQGGRIDCLEKRMDQLFSLTQLAIPNGNLLPGYGAATVIPTPPPAPTAPPSVSLDSASVTALANAIKAAA